jgi:hypothetical protein
MGLDYILQVVQEHDYGIDGVILCCQMTRLSYPIEQYILDTNTGKTTVLSCHRCPIKTGVEMLYQSKKIIAYTQRGPG